jgi:endonuclease/exonuclease/phosphatase family metal-dependent hydrolase
MPVWFPDFIYEHKEEGKKIKVLSYNIRKKDAGQKRKAVVKFPMVLDEIKKRDPDIICFQEYDFQQKGNTNINRIMRLLRPAKYYYAFANYETDAIDGMGLMILSKYPILKKVRIGFKRSGNAAMYIDVSINGYLTRIFCVHLQSLKFLKDNYDYLSAPELKYNDRSKDAIKDIGIKIKAAFMLRAQQAEYLSGYIKKCPYPIIVCGDFNDTPVSYSYHVMKGDLKDAFREAGHGFGKTYNGLAPSFRIDYVLFSKHMGASFFETIQVDYSDHFPVFTCIYYKSEREK